MENPKRVCHAIIIQTDTYAIISYFDKQIKSFMLKYIMSWFKTTDCVRKKHTIGFSAPGNKMKYNPRSSWYSI